MSTLGTSRGFTLIELVAVLIILAILAVAAGPSLLDLRTDAHRARVDSVRASFGASVSNAYLGCQRAEYAGRLNMPGFGPGTIDFNNNCYPADTQGSPALTVTLNKCVNLWRALINGESGVASTAGSGVDWLATAASPVCTYTYQADTTRSITYNVSSGVVAATNP